MSAATQPASNDPHSLLVPLHVRFIQELDTVSSTSQLHLGRASVLTYLPQKRQDLSYYFTEHLRMNGIYWGLTALALMGHKDALPRDELLQWVMSCWNDDIGACIVGYAGTNLALIPVITTSRCLCASSRA